MESFRRVLLNRSLAVAARSPPNQSLAPSKRVHGEYVCILAESTNWGLRFWNRSFVSWIQISREGREREKCLSLGVCSIEVRAGRSWFVLMALGREAITVTIKYRPMRSFDESLHEVRELTVALGSRAISRNRNFLLPAVDSVLLASSSSSSTRPSSAASLVRPPRKIRFAKQIPRSGVNSWSPTWICRERCESETFFWHNSWVWTRAWM